MQTKTLTTKQFIEQAGQLTSDIDGLRKSLSIIAALAAEHPDDERMFRLLDRLGAVDEALSKARAGMCNQLLPMLPTLRRLNDKTPE